MHILAFIALIFGLAKVFLILSLDKEKQRKLISEVALWEILKILLSVILLDGLLEIILGIFVLC